MGLTLQQALALQSGEQLTFGNAYVYDVISVKARGNGVYLELLRDDGFETFATQHHLSKAEQVNAKPQAPDYNIFTVPQLKAEIEARGLGLKDGGGTGTNGAWLKSDLVSLLERDDIDSSES